MKMSKKGFTLIELMIVVAIIGILAAIAIPKFADLISKSKEGATKGGLSTVRSALQVYYGDNEGWYPVDTTSLVSLTAAAKYLNDIPVAKMPGTTHPDIASIVNTIGDAGGWYYQNSAGLSNTWGNFAVNCTHEDINGRARTDITTVWSTF